MSPDILGAVLVPAAAAAGGSPRHLRLIGIVLVVIAVIAVVAVVRAMRRRSKANAEDGPHDHTESKDQR